MKFFIAAFFVLALAMGVQSSVLPWGWPGASVVVAGPWVPSGISQSQGAVVVGGAVPALSPVVVSAPVGLGASYVAKTRGAIHTAPLEGHIQSVANVNVAPAPGTL